MATLLQSRFIGSAVAEAGTAFTHGLNIAGSAVTPDWYHFHHNGAVPAGNVCTLYFVSATSTSFTVASSSGATTANIFLSYRHSIGRGS